MSGQGTVSLVLGSGGARGLAHIGVIEWLAEHGYEIRSIAGSSMGALIGGVYAAGELETYKNWVTALDKRDVFRLLDLSFGTTGLFKGERIIETLKGLVGERNIEELPISFTAVATDIEKEKEVWLTKGSLFDAIRASISVPTVFTPYKIDGRRLLDGGLVNPLPIAPTLRDTTDRTIAVSLSGRPRGSGETPEEDVAARPGSGVSKYHARIQRFIEDLQERFSIERTEDWDFLDVIWMSLDTMQNTIARLKLAAYTPDVTITISRDAARSFEFYRARELIELGRSAAQEMLHD